MDWSLARRSTIASNGSEDAGRKARDIPPAQDIIIGCPGSVQITLIFQCTGRTTPQHDCSAMWQVSDFVRPDILLCTPVSDISDLSTVPANGERNRLHDKIIVRQSINHLHLRRCAAHNSLPSPIFQSRQPWLKVGLGTRKISTRIENIEHSPCVDFSFTVKRRRRELSQCIFWGKDVRIFDRHGSLIRWREMTEHFHLVKQERQ